MPRTLDFQPHVATVESEGEAFKFLICDEIAEEWYETCRPGSRAEMRFIRDHLLKAGDLAVECGCHHGFTALLLSRWVGSEGRVIGFDVNARNVAIARRNMELNGVKNVEIHLAAVGNRTDRVQVTDSSNARVVHPFVHGDVLVVGVRLDDCLGRDIPDLIKIDVEGYELEVLKGLARVLAEGRSNLALEIHRDALRDYGASMTDVLELIGLQDYLCWFGVGDEANEAIARFTLGKSRVPSGPRVYLFAVPRIIPHCRA